MPTMLRHKPTGDLYVYTEIMAKRNDMEFVDVPDISPIPNQQNQVKKRDKKSIEELIEPILKEKQ